MRQKIGDKKKETLRPILKRVQDDCQPVLNNVIRTRFSTPATSSFQRGYIAITAVLVILAVVLAITISASLLSIGEAQSGLTLFKGEDTLNFVEGCMEDALSKIRLNDVYAGGTITRPEGSCVITIVSHVGSNWTINASTSDTKYVRTTQAVIVKSTSISLTSWKEI